MIRAAAGVFDEFEDREFLPANEAYQDKARSDLDNEAGEAGAAPAERRAHWAEPPA